MKPAQPLELALLRAASLADNLPTEAVYVVKLPGSKFETCYADTLPDNADVAYTIRAS
jgi:hypothetical protein